MAGPVCDVKPLKRSSSYQALPPYMSELRVVVLGNSRSQRCSVGNLIVGKNEFTKDLDCCVKGNGQFKDHVLTVINTPDLLRPDTEDKLTELIKELTAASAPGPHVFLLVLQPEDFTEQHKTRLTSFLEKFSDQSFDHSLVLLSPPRDQTQGFMEKYTNDSPLKNMISKCRYRYLNHKNLELPELLTRLGQIVKENNGKHISSEPYQTEDVGLTLTLSKNKKPPLNLVLCGRRGAGKTSAAEAILGGRALGAVSSSEQCVKHQGEVCGRWVSLVELPALSEKPLETVMQQCLSCISLCGPEGVHAFILVLPMAPLTDEDENELEILRNTLSCRVSDFMMIMFTVESDPAGVVNFRKETSVDVEELCQNCGGETLYLNIRDPQQVEQVLKAVEKLTQEGARGFTLKMFSEAQMGKVLEQQKSQTNPEMPWSQMGLRIVLIGKSGSGKSATANTILGKKRFQPRVAPKNASTVCVKASGSVEGRPVTVVNTPALFDKSFQKEPLYKELFKSIEMLSPGPHAFLLMLQIGNITKEETETLEVIQKAFGKKAKDFLLIVFTRGDELEGQPVESYINNCDDFVKNLIKECQGRYHVLNNKDETNRTQVTQLLRKTENMMQQNCGFTKDMFKLEKTEEELRKQVESSKRQNSELNSKLEQERTLKDKQLKEKEELMKQERQERREQEEEVKRRRKQDEAVRLEWKRKLEEAERRARAETLEKQRVEKKMEQLRKQTERKREEWEKERKDILENHCQELNQKLVAQSESNRQLQAQYLRKGNKRTFFLIFVFLFLFILLYHFFQSHK